MLYNEKNKILMYKWRQENKEIYNDITRRSQAKYRETNRDKHNEKELNRYYNKKLCNINLEILRLTNMYNIYA